MRPLVAGQIGRRRKQAVLEPDVFIQLRRRHADQAVAASSIEVLAGRPLGQTQVAGNGGALRHADTVVQALNFTNVAHGTATGQPQTTQDGCDSIAVACCGLTATGDSPRAAPTITGCPITRMVDKVRLFLTLSGGGRVVVLRPDFVRCEVDLLASGISGHRPGRKCIEACPGSRRTSADYGVVLVAWARVSLFASSWNRITRSPA